ncbi:hypothetical protein L226DRAFT_616152 [Lentinus tigrinus ALCF2SS1-7]|uniref:Proteophosphoglycan ppg4 n=1 Tax=Lentinus tigrinus ALCF2SS1-6 TaxID=1328759 RepID=A0A5C2S399_9APHY|nr:hypothetical protein L227DRAFT_655215 [Lentinus tigrinus ALCF2SS1-6]RPD70432.1 hypothetical protein L226DRAFT_616152 [Lentinus tigrinus ALCF2SS1-7]
MPESRLQAVLACLLPLIPLLLPDFDEQDEVERWPWDPVPYTKPRVPQYISASFSLETIAIAKTPAARELDSSLTPEVLADALTESWDDTAPVLQALGNIVESFIAYLSCVRVRISSPSPWILAGMAGILATAGVLLALAVKWWSSRPKLNPLQDAPGEQVPPTLAILDDASALQPVHCVLGATPDEQSRRSNLLVDGLATSVPQVHSSSRSPVVSLVERPPPLAKLEASQDTHDEQVVRAGLVNAPASPPVDDVMGVASGEQSKALVLLGEEPATSLPQVPPPSQAAVVSQDEGLSPSSTVSIDVPAPLQFQAPSSAQPTSLPEASSADANLLPDVPSLTTDVSPVAQSPVLSQAQLASPLENCSTSQTTCHVEPPNLADGDNNVLPPRSSWSLEKACEKAPFEAPAPTSPDHDDYTAPSSPRSSPQPHPTPTPQPPNALQPSSFLLQPLIQLPPEYYRAAPPLVTDEVINGVPTDVSERTEEPDSDHGFPGTPHACWYSAIRGRLAIVDDRGLTYGAQEAHPEGVMSSPETETPARFPLMMPQPLLAAVAPPPLLSGRDSQGLGLDMASDGEGPENSDHSDEEMVLGMATKSPVSDDNEDDRGSDSSVRHILRSDSPSSIHTIVPEMDEIPLPDAASAPESVQTLVDVPASAEPHDTEEAAEVEDYLSSSSEWEFVEAASPQPVRLTAPDLPDTQGKSVPEARPSSVPSVSSSKGSSKGKPAVTPLIRKMSRSSSRSRRPSVVIASTGLASSRPFALTPKGIDYAAEQLEAKIAAGDRGRRGCRKSISTEAISKHTDRSVPPRDYLPVRVERRNRLESVPARVDRDILDGARHPPLANDTQVRRGMCEIGRSRTKTASKATSSIKLEANPVSASRGRSAFVAPTPRTSRATSEPPVQRFESHLERNDAASGPDRDQRPPNLARTSYSDIVARGRSQEPRSRTQSERSVASVSVASSTHDDSTATSSPVMAGRKTEEASAREHATFDRKGKGRAVDVPAAVHSGSEPAKPADEFRSSSSAPSVPVRTGLIRKLSVELSARLLSKLPHGSRKLPVATTVQLRDIANSARCKSLLVQSGMLSAEADDVPVRNPDAAPSASGSLPDSGSKLGSRASSESFTGSVLGSSGTGAAPLRLPAVDSCGDSTLSTHGLPTQAPITQEEEPQVRQEDATAHDLSESTAQQQDRMFKSIPLLPSRRDRLPSVLAQPALSFSSLGGSGGPLDETKKLIAISQDDSPSSPSLAAGPIVSLGSWSSLHQTCDPGLVDASTTLAPFSPSPSQAGFSSDEGENPVVVRPDLPQSSSWMFDLHLHDKADAGMQNRGHQALPRGLTARRRTSTNSMRVQMDVGEAAGEPVPGVTRRTSARFTGGRFDGMKRNELIH